MLGFFRKLFSTDFMPHVYCLREPSLIALHAISDALIALSYFTIPLALLWLIRRRRDLMYPWMFALFGLFILGCGLTHVLAVVTLWEPAYRFSGLVKAVTAVASIATAVLLVRLLPSAVGLPNPQQHLAAIVESCEDAIISRSLDGRITSWNKSAERIFGFERSEMLGRRFGAGEDDAAQVQMVEVLNRIRSGETIPHLHTFRKHKDGRILDVSLTISPICDTSGQTVGASIIARDITELNRQRAELAAASVNIQHSESKFRTLVDFVPDMLWTTDAQGRVLYMSRRYLDYAGFALADLQGENWKKIVHPADIENVTKVWTESLTNLGSYETEMRLRRWDGTYRWFVVRGTPVLQPSGEVDSWLGSCTDIDEIKRVERALRRSNEELEQFAYAAAHDLQEPLRNVANAVGMLNRLYRDRLDQSAQEWITVSISGAKRIHEMVKDLLRYSRALDDATGPILMADSNRCLQIAMDNLAESIESKQAEVHAGALSPVAVEQTHLVQLFQNLIGNALKYADPSRRPVVHVNAVDSGSEIEFSIADNGIGFDPVYADRIFKVFKRLHNSQQYPGNGIGLAICARIVSHYGGQIWADAQPGFGATFRFTLPKPRPQDFN